MTVLASQFFNDWLFAHFGVRLMCSHASIIFGIVFVWMFVDTSRFSLRVPKPHAAAKFRMVRRELWLAVIVIGIIFVAYTRSWTHR